MANTSDNDSCEGNTNKGNGIHSPWELNRSISGTSVAHLRHTAVAIGPQIESMELKDDGIETQP